MTVLGEAPWIDVFVRGEGEDILVNLIRGIAYRDGQEVVANPAAPTV